MDKIQGPYEIFRQKHKVWRNALHSLEYENGYVVDNNKLIKYKEETIEFFELIKTLLVETTENGDVATTTQLDFYVPILRWRISNFDNILVTKSMD